MHRRLGWVPLVQPGDVDRQQPGEVCEQSGGGCEYIWAGWYVARLVFSRQQRVETDLGGLCTQGLTLIGYGVRQIELPKAAEKFKLIQGISELFGRREPSFICRLRKPTRFLQSIEERTWYAYMRKFISEISPEFRLRFGEDHFRCCYTASLVGSERLSAQRRLRICKVHDVRQHNVRSPRLSVHQLC